MDAKRFATVCVIAIATCLIAGVASASAAPTAIQAYAYSHSFATDPYLNEEGEIEQLEPPAIENNNAIAVDPETGDVIVANERLSLFVYAAAAGPADPPISSFGESLGESWTTLAVAPDGDLYAAAFNSLRRFKRNPGAPPTYTLDGSYAPSAGRVGAMALDPSTGDLLVAESGTVRRFDPSGNLVSSFQAPGQPFISALAVAADGSIFIVNAVNGGVGFNRALFRLSPSGQLLSERTISEPPEGSNRFYPATLVNDPTHEGVDLMNVTTLGGPAHVEGLTAAGEQIFVVPFPEPAARYAGLAVDPARGRLFGFTAEPTGVRVFEPATYPGVEPPDASAVTATSAHVSTEVDPGSPLPPGSFARFEYSDDGGTTWTATADQPQTAASTIEADLTGLRSNWHYLIRAAAGNEAITHFSRPASITTATVVPVTATDPATGVTETGAVLNGSINPVGMQTTYHFEYGTTSAYGNRVPAGIDAIAGGTYLTRAFSRTLTNLQPGTTYHYRLVATNAVGESHGEDRTFTTLPAGSVQARVFEQVTPADKDGGSIVANNGFQVATDGSQVTYLETSPAHSPSSPLFGVSFASRGSADWGSTAVDPPLNVPHSVVFYATLGISADMSHALVASNRVLAPGATENACNLYVVDLATKSFEHVATSESQFAFASFTSIAQSEKFVGGSPDFSTVLFNAIVPMYPGAPQAAFYRWTRSGGLEVESRLPDGTIPPVATPVGMPQGSIFRRASDDGDRAYYALAGGPEAGVYLREDGVVRAISVSHRAGDDPTVPQAGEFLGTSSDGRYAFFSANTALLTEDADPLENDVYRYDADTRELEYTGTQISASPFVQINVLGVSDDGSTIYLTENKVWRNGHLGTVPGPTGAQQGNAFVSPDGRYLAFAEPLSAGLPPDPEHEKVYLYDADTETTICASCRADGSNPGGARLNGGARSIGQPTSPFDARGDLFFSTRAGLVAADGNGSYDVYEYSGGEARLITPGTQPFDALFAAVSPDARDVYFTTAQGLVGRDQDQEVDVYDARIGGGLAAQNPPEPQLCIRDDCKATPNAAPEPRIGGSELLSGPGNVKPAHKKKRVCPKGKRAVKHKGKSRCVRRHPKKANHNRRQGR
jgi:hypothetical protein